MRLLCGSEDVQTGHLQPIIGTPCDVPVPRNVSSVFVLPPSESFQLMASNVFLAATPAASFQNRYSLQLGFSTESGIIIM